MEQERRLELSKYRFELAKECLYDSKTAFNLGRLKNSVNRSYYAIFNAMRAVTVLDKFDSKKHSGIISYFNFYYLRTKIFSPDISKLIMSAFEVRGDADYGDFYEVSNEKAKTQIENAEKVINMIQPYLEKCWEEIKNSKEEI